jgi:RNAse (barnase) inhibitor barstar
MAKTIVIDGNTIRDIPSFYTEINRVLMTGVDWQLGQSLDALNDVLHGGYGAIEGGEPVTLIWENAARNRRDLGVEATRQFYLAKLDQPEIYNAEAAVRQLAALNAGTGPTYFEIVLEIIAEHANIALILR